MNKWMHNDIELIEESLSIKLLEKYHNIIGNKFKKGTSIERIVEHIINYYQDIISCMPGNVYWLDKNCNTVGCNQNVLDMFGFSAQSEFKGLTFEEMGKIGNWTPEATLSFKNDTLAVINSGKAVLNVEEPPIPHADGRIIYFLTSRVPLFDHTGAVVGVVGISFDITSRKEMELQLKAAKERAEQASEAKTLFLANMSHDIKTPLSGIISTAEFLNHATKNPEFKTRANDIVQSGLCLLNFINELIKISSLEIKDASTEETRFKLKNLIDDIVILIKPAIAHKSLNFDVNYDKKIPKFLIGNRWYLYRILLNLLSNAIKFTHEGYINLDICLIKKSSKTILIKIDIKDTGTGIPKDKQTIIFDQFTRLTPSHKGIYQGSGLGLNIVKQFIDAMGGEIYVDSEPNKGSTFTLIVPLKKSLIQEELLKSEETFFPNEINFLTQQILTSSQKEIQAKAEFEKNTTQPIHVLLVEDNQIAARAARDTLLALGCQVDLARSGNEALILFKKGHYQMIYMDLGLPDMSGIEVTKQIRMLEDSSEEVPILALSAHVDKELHTICCDSGMNDVLAKPLLRELAKKTLQRHVSRTKHPS